MFCSQCGTENRNDRKFCTECGAPLQDYTKPKENLIMPDEIKKEQEMVVKRNRVRKIFNFALCIIFVMAVAFTIISFLVKNELRTAFAIVCVALFVVFLIVFIIKKKKLKKMKSKN